MPCLFGWLLSTSSGEEPRKSEQHPSPPRIVVARPLGVIVGTNGILTLRGYYLTNAVSAKIIGLQTPVSTTLKGGNDAPKIDGRESNQVGDQELKLEFTLPSDAPLGTNLSLVVINSAGESLPYPLVMLPGCDDARESNRAFREAQSLSLARWVRGVLPDSSAVHVYRVTVDAAQDVTAEVFASRLGSTLDAALAVYDGKGNVMAHNDDTFGRDPALTFHAPIAGDYFVVVTSVNERSSKIDDYLLRVDRKP